MRGAAILTLVLLAIAGQTAVAAERTCEIRQSGVVQLASPLARLLLSCPTLLESPAPHFAEERSAGDGAPCDLAAAPAPSDPARTSDALSCDGRLAAVRAAELEAIRPGCGP